MMKFCRVASVAVLALTTATAFAVPDSAASAPVPSVHSQPKSKSTAAPVPVHLVDINSAGRKELMTLPGIGQAEADKIIAGRPYHTKTELVSKNVLATGPYLSLKTRVVAMPPAKPKAAKA